MNNKPNKFIYWTPRILSILFICFLALFSLDVFESASTPAQIVLGLVMHNLPVFALLAVLLIAWKYEIVGGIGFILAGVLYISVILTNVTKTGFEWYYLAWAAQISGIAFLIGILFLVGWKKKKSAR